MNQLLALFWLITCLFGLGSAALAQVPLLSQKLEPTTCDLDVRVEEYFQHHLATITQAIQKQERFPYSETEFVYVVSFLSGLNFPLESYSGQPKLQLAHVEAFRTWYAQHRDRICWPQITQVQELLAEPLLSDKQVDRLESFKIK